MSQHYCKQYGCLATYPCSIHPDPDEEQITGYFAEKPTIIKTTDLPIRVIIVIPLPCGHNYPEPKKKISDIICGYCDTKWHIEIKDDVVELTRL